MGKTRDHAEQTVERRLRLSPLTARKLAVAAAIRGLTESELVEWALLPHLAFEVPELPDVRVEAIGFNAGGRQGRGGAAARATAAGGCAVGQGT